MANFKEIDELHEKAEYKRTYDLLKPSYDSDQNNVEVLWRLARACHNMASSFDQKNPNKKALIIEGHKYAIHAYKLDEKHFLVLKWAAVLTGGLTDFLGTKEKIQEGNKFKSYLDKALAINGTEYSLLHMRGRFSFSVANLSWFERKAASAFFATPPTATIDDALMDFLEVEKLRPALWIDNLMYVGRCYLSKGNKPEAARYFKLAQKIEPVDDADKETLEEIKKLLKTAEK
jgi:tetratricopeptide (TPR) repeat protein